MPKKMNSQKEFIFSNHSAPKKMNNSEESILAGHQPAPIKGRFPHMLPLDNRQKTLPQSKYVSKPDAHS
jgi:hypothetical protein